MRYLAPVLNTADVGKARRYYLEGLGFEEWFTLTGDDGRITFCGVRLGNAHLMLGTQEGLAPEVLRHRGADVSFYIDVGDLNVDEYYERVRAGVEVIEAIADKPWGDRVFTIRDPNGYRLSFAKTVEQLSDAEISARLAQAEQ
jgi:uncharacterized glyoxalase superfamily protein PhnB